MAQDVSLSLNASTVRAADGRYNHTVTGSASADMTISWDHTKFTTRQSVLDAFTQLASETGKNQGLK